MSQQKGKTIGIDIGDTNFRISYLENGTPRLIRDPSGRSCFPSKVSFLQGGGSHVGFDAEMFGIPENTVMHPMTIIGASFSQLTRINNRYAYQFCQGDQGVYIDAHRAFPSVPDVLVAIFVHAKKLAEEHLGYPVEAAVIAIPDGASDPKRIAIKKCAEAAGLIVKQLLNQTTAAALGYRFDLGNKKRIAVIDVGASHTSLSILDGGQNQVEMIRTSHCEVGTNNLHSRIIGLINDLARREYGFDMLGSGQDFIRQEMSKEAADALVALSENESAEISIGCALPNGGRAVVDVLRRNFIDEINPELRVIDSTIATGRMPVDIVLLIGGGSNIPVVRQLVDKVFQKPPFVSPSISSSEAVAIGAAVKGGIIDGSISSRSIEKTVHELGTFYRRDLMDVLIPKGTPFPCHVSKEYSMGTRRYTEKVYQWVGRGSGQDMSESHKDLIVLADKQLVITGLRVRCTFIIDINGVAQFVVTDLGDNKQFVLTGFSIS